MATDDGVTVILETRAEALQSEHETELFEALEDTFCGPGRKKGEKFLDYALREQSNLRELAKQGVRVSDVQGFLLLCWANLSTLVRPHCHHDAGGQQLVSGDVRKACKRYADEFLRDPKEHDAH